MINNLECSHFIKKIVRVFAFGFFILIGFATRGQKLDSLQTALKKIPFDDTAHVNILSDIADIYGESNLDSMIIYAGNGLTLANRINYERGKGDCMSELGLAYLRKSDYEKSLNYYEGALASFEKKSRFHAQANTLLDIADIYYSQGKRDSAIEYYNKGIQIFDKLRYATGKGFALMSIGGVYEESGNYTEAINNYLEALTELEKDNYKPGIAMSLASIANIYSELEDYKNAAEYLGECLAVDESKSSNEQKLYVVGNIGSVFSAMKEYHKALIFFNRGASLADSVGDAAEKNAIIAHIADMYYGLQNYDTALVKYNEALKMGEKIKDPKSIIEAGNGIGRIMVKKGMIKDGVKHFLKSFELARHNQARQAIYETSLALSDAYEKAKDYTSALKYYKIYYNYRDSLNNEKIDKRVQQLQFNYDLGKKESMIKLLEKDKVIEHNRIEKQRLVQLALIFGIVLLIIISILLYRNNHYEKMSKERLFKQKDELQQQAKKLEELNRFKDKTFSVLSHDLRGPLNSVAATLAMLNEDMISSKEFTSLKPDIDEQLSALNILVENLLNWAKSYIQGQTNAQSGTTFLYSIALQNIKFIQSTADKKQITICNNIPETVCAYCDPDQVEIVMRNLLINAVKFTKQDGTITLSCVNESGKVKLFIADTGVGMTRGQMDKLFTPFAGNSTFGTQGEVGTGLGLLLCHEFIKANNGTISVTSEIGKGSTFTIVFPEVL